MENIVTTEIQEKEKHKSKKVLRILIITLTIGIITMLLVSGPANAYTLNMTQDKRSLKQGEDITFDVNLNVNTNNGEYSRIDSITLTLNGPARKTCVFNVSGNILSGCVVLKSLTVQSSIDPTSKNLSNYWYSYSPFGYFYGYGYDNLNLVYKITLNTQGYETGTYNTELQVLANGEVLIYEGDEIEITAGEVPPGPQQVTKERGSMNRVINLKEGITGQLKISEGDVYKIVSDTYFHQLIIDKINPDSVDILLFSDPQNINLKVGESKELDLNEDGEMDSSISLWYLGENKGTLFIIQAYESKITKEKETKKVAQNIISNNKTYYSLANSRTNNEDFFEKFGPAIIFVIIDVILLGLVGISYLIKRREKNYRRQKPIQRPIHR